APSAATLWATLAAPPRLARAAVTCNTGIGASGEMRLTSPDTYRSSITSPRTSTVRRAKSGIRPAIVPAAISRSRSAPTACSMIDTVLAYDHRVAGNYRGRPAGVLSRHDVGAASASGST